MEETKSNNKIVIASLIVILLIAGILTVYVLSNNQTTATPNNNTTGSGTTTSQTTGGTTDSTAQEYKNGSYTASGSYVSPGGNESVSVNLTIANDAVTAVNVTGTADNPESKNYQAKFVAGITGEVVGKKIDDIMLTKVNGSSLTPVGFMAALADIKTQAAN